MSDAAARLRALAEAAKVPGLPTPLKSYGAAQADNLLRGLLRNAADEIADLLEAFERERCRCGWNDPDRHFDGCPTDRMPGTMKALAAVEARLGEPA